MSRHNLCLAAIGIIIELLCSGGCRDDQPRLVPVEGKITLDGAPLPGVVVLFDQPDVTGELNVTGKTDDQGRFVLHPLGEDSQGGTAGVYRVTLTTAVAAPGAPEGAPLPPERIPAAYRNGRLNFEVPASGTTEANFDLKSR